MDIGTVGWLPAVPSWIAMRIGFYLFLLAAVVALCWWRGRSDERLAATICVAGSVLTGLAGHPLPQRFASFEPLSFTIDVGVFLAFVGLALRSQRFWPLWVAGLQLTATTVHLLKILEPNLMRFVFGAALAFWSYPILLLIGVGAWRTRMVEQWRRQLQLQDCA